VNFDKIYDSKFSGVSIDSRNIKPDEIFFAIAGENSDGHNYIKNVFDKKVKLAVVNENWFVKNRNKFKEKSFVIVDNTTLALGQFAKEYKKNFTIPVFCIGGSNGKTSTKDLIASVLSQKYNVLKSEGNFNNHIGLPLTLLKLNKKHNFCLLEIGSNHFNELKYLCEIAEPDFGLITNIGREHLEFFKDLDGVAKEEFTLFDYLINEKDGTCFINLDDKYIRKYSRKINSENSFTYSYNYDSDVKCKFLEFTKKFEPVIEVTYNNKSFKTNIATFGMHSILNGIAAVSAGLFFGLSNKQIKEGLSKISSVSSKRMEVGEKNGVTIINDAYNSNPESIRLGLVTIKRFKTKGKKHIVLSDMLEMGDSSEKVHSEIGKLVRQMKFENLYTYGKFAYKIFENAKGIKNNYNFKTKEELSDFLKLILKKDDIVYVKGSRGMKMEDVVNSLLN
jgi:UDP-N-acetylmuramoyl-tripeptide--D-alanyl-D-alanine ligase